MHYNVITNNSDNRNKNNDINDSINTNEDDGNNAKGVFEGLKQ